MTWWESLEQYVRDLDESDDAPDPWGMVELAVRTLTDGQIEYLGNDQPEVPRLREGPAAGLAEAPADRAGEGTGNSPGDG